MVTLLTLVLAYFVGSIPWNHLVVKALAGQAGVQTLQSLSLKQKLAKYGLEGTAALFVANLGKGMAPLALLACLDFTEDQLLLTALALLAGNQKPLFGLEKESRGFSLFLGMMLVLSPYASQLVISIWAATFLLSRSQKAASLTSIIAAPVIIWAPSKSFGMLFFGLACCVFILHSYCQSFFNSSGYNKWKNVLGGFWKRLSPLGKLYNKI